MTRSDLILEGLTPQRRRHRNPNQDLTGSRRKLKIRLCATILLIVGCVGGSVAAAGANCNDDCKNEYVSALNDCRTQYEQGGKDLQDLEECLADTRGEYDDCIDDCTSLGAGGVVACSSSIGLTLATFSASPTPNQMTVLAQPLDAIKTTTPMLKHG